MTTTTSLLCVLIVVAVAQGLSLKPFKNGKSIFPSGKIIGGEDTDITSVPYVAQVVVSGFQICGASILSSRYALTAAHCTYNTRASNVKVRYGTSHRNSGGTIVKVSKVIQHPKYNPETLDYDATILRLRKDIEFSDSVNYIILHPYEPWPGLSGRISGWGTRSLGGNQPDQLQSVTIPLVSRYDCEQVYNGDMTVSDTMICAGAQGLATCQGDSGTPLVVEDAQAGIASWSYGCADAGYPGVYTLANSVREFIDDSTEHTAKWIF